MKLMKKLLCLALVAVAAVTVTACDGEEEGPSEVSATYTYNTATNQFPTNWNPHTYQTATDSTILDYTVAGFYTFDYNETKDGYSIVPSMATSVPVDVSSQYVGEKWGIEEGEVGRAYTVSLREDIKWEDGTAIKAEDFVTSAQLLLNPIAGNHRADQLYSGDLVVVNAQNYFYSGVHAYTDPMVSADMGAEGYVDPSTFVKNDDGVYFIGNPSDKKDMAININKGGNWGSELSLFASNGYFAVPKLDEDGNPVVDEEGKPVKDTFADYVALAKAANKDGDVVITEKTLPLVQNCIAFLHGFPTVADYAAALQEAGKDASYAYVEWEEMGFYGKDNEITEWENVGLFASGEYELTFILEKKLTGFYLLYNLSGSWLVHEPTYTKCETIKNGVYTNSYGTSADTYMSYGPYKLTTFQSDKVIKFEKNPYYFEYNDQTVDPIYQTTHVQIDYVKEESTRLELFNQGKLDAYGLSANDMENYAQSDYIYYTKGASTFYLALNPGDDVYGSFDNDNPGKCKSILTVKEFRMALSFALDRAAFALATAPTNSPAIAMFSDLIISDPENGVAYRTTEEAKDVVLEFWGLTDQVGEGKKYATKDDAIDSITGYDPAGAKALFDAAYDKAIESGIMEEGDVVPVIIGLASATATFYTKGYEFLVNCYTKAVEGTKLEGKLKFSKNDTIGNDFADRLNDNTVDMLFGVGWNGSTLNPYGLITAYTDPDYQYDSNTNTKNIPVDINVGGTTLRLSLYDWTMDVLSGVEKQATVIGEDGKPVVDRTEEDGTVVYKTQAIAAGTDAPNATRLAIFAACEDALLQLYNLVPLIDDASAALKGMQIKYYTEDYIYGVGRGGIKYMTYHLNDAEWDAFVESQNGSLNYK